MKAINYSKYGSPEVIQVIDIDIPKTKDNELLIQVATSSLSPAECAFRKADPFIVRLFAGLFKPKGIPGDMFAGTVYAIGSQVSKFKLGERVFGTTGPSMGAHSEYVALKDTEAIVKLADELSFEEATSIADGAITALPFIRDHAKLSANQHILINGASGSIGTYAIQLAKYYGAKVTGVCSKKNHDLVSSLGADYVIDYTEEDFSKNLSTYDVVFDTVGKSSFKKCKKALTAKGLYLTTVPDFLAILHNIIYKNKDNKKAIFAATGLRKASDKIADFEFLSSLAKEGKLKSIIDTSYDFQSIKEGHYYVDKGHKVGNVILKINK